MHALSMNFSFFSFKQTILFTTDENILAAIAQNDACYSTLISSAYEETAHADRPSTSAFCQVNHQQIIHSSTPVSILHIGPGNRKTIHWNPIKYAFGL